MPDATIDLIKDKIGITELVRQYVELKPAGKNLKGLCPFHGEKSPSFMVSPERRIWHCFGCGKGGDIFGFLMQYENIEFIEALKILADRAGVTLQRTGTSDQKKYDTLYEILRIAKDYFKNALGEAGGAAALNYLHERGLKPETINEFELGLASASSDALLRHLTKMGYGAPEIERAGLIFKTERGTYWDRFRNRIMFPLHNHFGKVIGFTGRIMPGFESPEVGKYINSPETPLFNKSKLLFGFFKSKAAIRETGVAVLVEGQMDFLMAWQDSVKNLAATSGTAPTADHLKLIRRMAENLVLSFDNDSAGKAAAERTIDLAQEQDLNTKVIIVGDPTLKDPAEIGRLRPGHFAELIARAVPAMEYYFDYYGINASKDIALRKKALRSILLKIKRISSPVERQHWITELSGRSGLPENVLLAEMAGLKSEVAVGEKVSGVEAQKQLERAPAGRLDRIIQRLLSLAVRDSGTLKLILEHRALVPERYYPLIDLIAKGDKAEIPPDLLESIDLIYLQSGFDPMPGEAELLIKELKKEGGGLYKRELQQRIARAEREKDAPLLAKLLEEYKTLTSL